MFIIINNKETLIQNITWLNKFENNLYIPNFPNDNEREPFDNIKNRIINNEYPKTIITLLIKNDDLIGGCIIDLYEECNSIEPIYLVIDKDYRNKGYGKILLDEAISNINNSKHIFLEVDDPNKSINYINNTINPQQRLNMYLRWGFKILNLNYIQPKLSNDTKSEENLLLLYKGEIINKNDLKKFLYSFYIGLNAKDDDNLVKMFNEIDKLERLFK